MAKLHIFGSCSGTEPMPGRHHCSFAIDVGGVLYWFDAGENSSYTAHLMGLDLLNIREIFISHTHMDHVGGLGNLLWNIRKLSGMKKAPPVCGGVEVIIPDADVFASLIGLLRGTEGGFVCPYPVTCRETADGVIFDDGTVKVESIHNYHLPHNDGEKWRSYSFLVTITENGSTKRVIFSGDVKSPADCESFLKDGCDIFLMETGHHNPVEVAGYLNDTDYKVGRLCFIHHGRHLLDHYAEMRAGLDAAYRGQYTVCEDAMTLDI